MPKRKRMKIRTVDHEIINMNEPHVYLVREMSLGEVLDQVETTDIKVARKAYNKCFPPSLSKSPSLRVDGKELVHDCEINLMDAYGDMNVPISPPTEKKPPRKVKKPREAYVIYRVEKYKKALYINRAADEMLGKCDYVQLDIGRDNCEIVMRPADNGPHVNSQREVSAHIVLRGIPIAPGIRYPVTVRDGGLVFKYQEVTESEGKGEPNQSDVRATEKFPATAS